MTSHTLSILLVEDNPDDETLIQHELRKGSLNAKTTRVETRDEYLAALDQGGWDLIIADYFLPGIGGMEALSILKGRKSTIPFLLVSGTIGEEIAVESIKAGADDYLLKQNLARLVPAVTRAIREAAERQKRVATEHELHESREQLELIYNSVSDCLVFQSRTPDGRWLYSRVNRAFLKKLEEGGVTTTADQLLGREVREVDTDVLHLDPDTVNGFANLRHQAISTGQRISTERRLKFPKMEYVCEILFLPSFDSEGVCRHLLIDSRDVTALRRTEEKDQRIREQMIQSQKLESLGTLAGGITHDFNNLLTGIFGFADLAKRTSDLAAVHGYCDQIVHTANRARDLVGRILTFSRQQPVHRRPVPLGTVVSEIIPLLQASFPNTVELVIRLPAPGPMVLADTGQLQQVVINLCTNAIHAMPQGGRLTLTVEEVVLTPPLPESLSSLTAGPHAQLSVSDTGTGMAPETLHRIFEPFFTTKPVGEGTGLGLSVVHSMIREHQGAIRVSSTVGIGTTFEIFLPVAAEDRTPETPAPPALGRGERVLCIDDDVSLAHLTARMLTSLGYRPTSFSDPVSALAAFETDPTAFDAILTDSQMPIWSGMAFARRVAQLRPELPIVLVTGAVEPEEVSAIQGIPCGVLLSKPYTIDQLAVALSQAIGRMG
jgi:signal transduction histidine kinase